MDDGIVPGTSRSGTRQIWTGIYKDVEGLPRGEDFLMLFTVSDGMVQAEEAFENHIAELQDAVYDISASERTTEVALLPDESPLHAVTRLHQLGYRFVFPLRENIEDDEIADLVSTLLHVCEE